MDLKIEINNFKKIKKEMYNKENIKKNNKESKKELQLTLADYFDISPYKFKDSMLQMLKMFSFYTS